MRKTTLMQKIELEKRTTLEEYIRQQTARGLTVQDIANEIGVTYNTLRAWLPRLGMRSQRVVIPE